MFDTFFIVLCNLAAACCVLFSWAATAIFIMGTLSIAIDFSPDGQFTRFLAMLDFSSNLRLRQAGEYTIVIAIILGAGALIFGGLAGAWAMFAALGRASEAR